MATSYSHRRRSAKDLHRRTKRRRSLLQIERLEERRLLATIAWDGGGGSNHDWFAAANWVGDQMPGAIDTAQIDLAGTFSVTLS